MMDFIDGFTIGLLIGIGVGIIALHKIKKMIEELIEERERKMQE